MYAARDYSFVRLNDTCVIISTISYSHNVCQSIQFQTFIEFISVFNEGAGVQWLVLSGVQPSVL